MSEPRPIRPGSPAGWRPFAATRSRCALLRAAVRLGVRRPGSPARRSARRLLRGPPGRAPTSPGIGRLAGRRPAPPAGLGHLRRGVDRPTRVAARPRRRRHRPRRPVRRAARRAAGRDRRARRRVLVPVGGPRPPGCPAGQRALGLGDEPAAHADAERRAGASTARSSAGRPSRPATVRRSSLFRLPGYVGGEPAQPVPRDVIAAMVAPDAGPGAAAAGASTSGSPTPTAPPPARRHSAAP